MTNGNYLQDVLALPAFHEGRMDTGYIERELGQATEKLPIAALIAAALSGLGAANEAQGAESQPGADLYSPWARGDAFRIGARK